MGGGGVEVKEGISGDEKNKICTLLQHFKLQKIK